MNNIYEDDHHYFSYFGTIYYQILEGGMDSRQQKILNIVILKKESTRFFVVEIPHYNCIESLGELGLSETLCFYLEVRLLSKLG